MMIVCKLLFTVYVGHESTGLSVYIACCWIDKRYEMIR